MGDPAIETLRITVLTCPIIYSQSESSEEFLGEWIEQRGIRDEIIIATKVIGVKRSLRR